MSRKRRAAPLAALEHLDRAALLDDVEPPGLALRPGDVDRLREAAREDARLELRLLRRRCRATGGGQGDDADQCDPSPHASQR